jgi:hypothetical protein
MTSSSSSSSSSATTSNNESDLTSSSSSYTLPFPLDYIAAPLVGQSDLPFRMLCRKYGQYIH